LTNNKQKLAIVLFNLGGPDDQASVQPFLRNLFRDPAIIQAPKLVRESLAWFISTVRAKEAKANYAKMGGGSPLLPETQKQADALSKKLHKTLPNMEVRIFTAMRYWHPYIEEIVSEVNNWGPNETVLLPLYPQFSTTTTGSSLKEWQSVGGKEARVICCYPKENGFVTSYANLIREGLEKIDNPANFRLLFSAHGLPEKVIEAGDPYKWQVDQTVAAILEKLPEIQDWQTCFQSRVGPLKWISPSTGEAIEKAAGDGKNIILAPIAFVSEHIETLVELDEEYAILAKELGVAQYIRISTPGCHKAYIDGLADLVSFALKGAIGMNPPSMNRICPNSFVACPCKPLDKVVLK
jgi:ferrochelatase